MNLNRLRQEMVEKQLIPRGITDSATLKAMGNVPRHAFVPNELVLCAYDDRPLPIGEGQTISQPYIVALMTQAAYLTPEARVLEIGTGSGYGAAILAGISNKIFTIERVSKLADQARRHFVELDLLNIVVKVDDGTFGWESEAPFDAILVTAAAPFVPQSLFDQLKIGGRLVIPVGDRSLQSLLQIIRTGPNTQEERVIEPVRFVPLISEGDGGPSG